MMKSIVLLVYGIAAVSVSKRKQFKSAKRD